MKSNLTREQWQRMSVSEKQKYAEDNGKLISGDTPATDATTINEIWKKLTPPQQEWIKKLNTKEREYIEHVLHHYGENKFLTGFQGYAESLDYARNM